MQKVNIQDEIRRITNETAANAAAKALEVADLAKQKAAEVSSMAISKALDASTLAAEKAAQAAVAAASIATATSLDLSYIKKDISDTKADVKEIKEKLDNKYVSKEEFNPIKEAVNNLETKFITKDQFSTVRNIVYGMVGTILLSVLGAIMFLVVK